MTLLPSLFLNFKKNNIYLLADIYFMECDVEDESTENMSDCWRTSIAFIRSAYAAGGKVLVQLWGRSRSASVVSFFLFLLIWGKKKLGNLQKLTKCNFCRNRVLQYILNQQDVFPILIRRCITCSFCEFCKIK
jgi:hypothetical protein